MGAAGPSPVDWVEEGKGPGEPMSARIPPTCGLALPALGGCRCSGGPRGWLGPGAPSKAFSDGAERAS